MTTILAVIGCIAIGAAAALWDLHRDRQLRRAKRDADDWFRTH